MEEEKRKKVKINKEIDSIYSSFFIIHQLSNIFLKRKNFELKNRVFMIWKRYKEWEKGNIGKKI